MLNDECDGIPEAWEDSSYARLTPSRYNETVCFHHTVECTACKASRDEHMGHEAEKHKTAHLARPSAAGGHLILAGLDMDHSALLHVTLDPWLQEEIAYPGMLQIGHHPGHFWDLPCER